MPHLCAGGGFETPRGAATTAPRNVGFAPEDPGRLPLFDTPGGLDDIDQSHDEFMDDYFEEEVGAAVGCCLWVLVARSGSGGGLWVLLCQPCLLRSRAPLGDCLTVNYDRLPRKAGNAHATPAIVVHPASGGWS